MDAIMEHETGGDCTQKGASGEDGCFQYLPPTWQLFSKDVYGEVRPMTVARERYVTTKKVEEWIAEGYNVRQIAQIWNTGRPGPCIKGINAKGVRYDSCAYERSIIAILASRN